MPLTVKQIYDFIDKISPFKNQESYDNSGLLTGSFNSAVKKICLCLDVTADVIIEAREKSADLLISHHPVIFKAISAINSESTLHKLIQSGIPCIAAHTNFDVAENNMSDIMLDLLGLPQSENVLNIINPDGSGFGKTAEFDKPVTATELARMCKKSFKSGVVRYTDSGKPIKRIAVCSGAGGDDLVFALNQNCGALVTGDVKHSMFIAARDAGVTLVDAGHFATEITFCGAIRGRLKQEFPDITVFVAEKAVDPCSYFY